MSVYVCISLDASFAVLSQEGLAQQCVIFLCITLAPSHYRQGCQFMFFFLFFFFFFFFLKMRSQNTTHKAEIHRLS